MKKKILVVDDDVNTVKLLKVNLEKCGYDVVAAFNGKDGLEKFKTEKPALIIADIMMPGMDGYHFCWDVLFEDGLYISPVPKIIMLTGRDKKLDKGISEKIGVDAYITKPFDIKFLIEKVKEILGDNIKNKKKKIIIIDDDPNIANLVRTNLNTEKYECISALDGEEGLRKIESEKPDLIVLDLIMPKKTGYEVCSEVKTNLSTAKIPVIMLTIKKEHRERYIGTIFLKADEYIPKPFDIKDLVKKIEKLIVD
ncbi:MAG: hypothetical protein A2539_03200 [Elusimicrobia bacterium RIFOXYD2_FULL_34_15]|nr:MAG: hypothetical protein A2539_03200 [Elusimicrobia bacterium RIFOXYD2_FULL_34_15]HAM39263.1 hypothetical protein [Elusimicrobiota bacterium]